VVNPSGLIARPALPVVPGLVLAIDDGECVPIVLTDDKARRGLFDGTWQEGLGELFVVVLGEQLTRLGKQHRENQPGSHDHNRPKPIPPTRVLLLCIGRWWSDFRFISCGLLAHFGTRLLLMS
jgi:hypothetical protein